MKSYLKYVFGVLIFFLTSCGKDSLTGCFQGTGKVVKEIRDISTQCIYIKVENNLNLILTNSTSPQIIVEAGENLQNNILTKIVNDSLFLSNNNHCNWLRDYSKPINIYVSSNSLFKIDYQGSGDISATHQVEKDSMIIDVRNGSGSITLDLNVQLARLNLHEGTSDFNISGKALITFIYAADYGPFFCRNFETKHLYINNRGTNDCYVNSGYELGATIENLGNIYYYGDPEIVNSTITGEGKLIKME